MMRGDSKRVDLLREIYATVGANSFRARDVPVNSNKLYGMHLDGMLDRVTKVHDGAGHRVAIWRISQDALCTMRGDKIDREQSRRQMRRGI